MAPDSRQPESHWNRWYPAPAPLSHCHRCQNLESPAAWPKPAPPCGRHDFAWRSRDLSWCGAAGTRQCSHPAFPSPSRRWKLARSTCRNLRPRQRCSCPMPVDVPTEILRRGLMHHPENLRKIGGGVMLKALLADHAQQILQVRDLHHASAAERLERIVGEPAAAHIAAHLAKPVVGGEAREGHGRRFHAAHASAKCIQLADGARDDLLEIHPHIREE